MMRICSLSVVTMILATASVNGCGSNAGTNEPGEDTGEASLAVQSVPSDTYCISVTAAGATRSVTREVEVTPGSPASALLTGLPTGSVTFSGSAYSTACRQVTADSVAVWVADSTVVTVTITTPASVSLVFRRNGRAELDAGFIDDSGLLTRSPMPVPVSAFAYAVDQDGDIFILGGGIGNVAATTTVQEYHTATATWEVDTGHGGTLAPLPAPRAYGFDAGVLAGRLHCVGGWDDNLSYRSDHYVYDKRGNTWSTAPSIPSAPIGQFSAVVGDALFVMGGWGGMYQSAVYRYTDTNGWVQMSPMPTPRNHATTGVIDGAIYAIGGEGLNQQQLDVVEKYDISTNAWSTGYAPLPIVRSFLGWSGSPVINGKIYTTANYVYDPTSNTWSSVEQVLPDTIGGAVAWNNAVFAFGSNQTLQDVLH